MNAIKPADMFADGVMKMPPACRVCTNVENNHPFTAREMMFGLREQFDYLECGACGSLQIVEIPSDLARYYPKDYYAFSLLAREKYPWWQRILKRARARHAILGKGWIGGLLSRYQGHWPYFDWFRAAGLNFHSTILDVGCGRGTYLLRFASDGFTSLTGIDPYVESDIQFPNGVRIYRKTLEEMTGTFDCVFLHHSLEHMFDPVDALSRIHQLVRPGGVALIAIPIASCWAWREYGANWFQLDAPRHLVIPSRKGMATLAAKTGFTLENTLFDSSDVQMIGSETYRRDIPWTTAEKQGTHTLFTAEQLATFHTRTEQLNQSGDADQGCFILRKLGKRP